MKDFRGWPDPVYHTHGLSGEEAHQLYISGCMDVRRHCWRTVESACNRFTRLLEACVIDTG